MGAVNVLFYFIVFYYLAMHKDLMQIWQYKYSDSTALARRACKHLYKTWQFKNLMQVFLFFCIVALQKSTNFTSVMTFLC